jgi:hypothetical protein
LVVQAPTELSAVIEKVLAEYAAATATSMASKTDVVTTRRVQLDDVVGRGDLPQKQRAERGAEKKWMS